MFLISFKNNVFESKNFEDKNFENSIVIMAKFEGKDRESKDFYEMINSKLFLDFLRKAEFIEFWYRLIEKIDDDIDIVFENDKIIDESFENIYYLIQLRRIEISQLLYYNYSKYIEKCFAIIEDDNLLNIIRTCTNLLIEKDYPTFYF